MTKVYEKNAPDSKTFVERKMHTWVTKDKPVNLAASTSDLC